MKYIFLDIDNTLLDFDAYVQHTMEVGFAHFGLRAYEPWMFDIFLRENSILWQRIEQQTLSFQELEKIRWNIIFSYLDITFDGEVFETYFKDALYFNAIPVSGAMELLQKLRKKNFILCVASNGPYKQQVNRLTIGQMIRYFDHFFVSEKIGVSKPAKEFFDGALKELEDTYGGPINAQECLMIGDSLSSDMTGGINAGMKTCFFNRKGSKSKLEGIDYEVTDLSQIPDLPILN